MISSSEMTAGVQIDTNDEPGEQSLISACLIKQTLNWLGRVKTARTTKLLLNRGFKGGVSRILLKNIVIYKSNAAKSSLLSLCICAVVTVYGDTAPSVCILRFWFHRGVSEWGEDAFPPVNDSTQVRLRAP